MTAEVAVQLREQIEHSLYQLYRIRAPDFLVIDPAMKNFWFIEVKKYGDKIHKEQYRWYFRNSSVKILVVVV